MSEWCLCGGLFGRVTIRHCGQHKKITDFVNNKNYDEIVKKYKDMKSLHN